MEAALIFYAIMLIGTGILFLGALIKYSTGDHDSIIFLPLVVLSIMVLFLSVILPVTEEQERVNNFSITQTETLTVIDTGTEYGAFRESDLWGVSKDQIEVYRTVKLTPFKIKATEPKIIYKLREQGGNE